MTAARTSHGSESAAAVRVAGGAPGERDREGPASRSAMDFGGIRREFGLPGEFPTDALMEAERAVAAPLSSAERTDATDLPMVTVDPAGAKDLDQAVLLRRRGRGGFRVHYAIADTAAFVPPGGALDRETFRRGQTLYLPDGNIPLHPPVLSEGAASLLPEQVRPAVLWTVDLDPYGSPVRVDVRRAVVRSVAALDYRGLLRSFEAGTPHPAVEPLPEVGLLRREQTVHRGAIELGLPEQRVEFSDSSGWRLGLRPRMWLEAFNAEISLLTGMCAAEIMIAAGVGVLRTVPEPDEEAVRGLRRSAERLGVYWPPEQSPADFLTGLEPLRPESLAMHVAGTRLLRGAGYTAFQWGKPSAVGHAGIGAAYAHVTAPLRRLVDRLCTEVCLAVVAGRTVPEWVREGIVDIPSAMGNSDRLASRVERACIAQVQAWELADRVGEVFTATVLRTDGEAGTGEVFVREPPVIARCRGAELVAGQRIPVRLVEADVTRREVLFESADRPSD
ncbi:Exoribonuclease R [Actinopolyspora xinjiangensis]|uniref:Exoribonuclease R n=1 Tax=Actinopolyspora xinjiangensis TaxID=405564 RepID=A0A1H0UGB4_9ACTN|nr:RNB domain-containing ribonuclease [Actinopolyspora xinjiangensis]SDP65110.1 Exoribonuclease R [Actinopolyspora xinjiangensis]